MSAHWTKDEDQIATFQNRLSGLRLTMPETLKILKARSLSEYKGTMGQALNTLAKSQGTDRGKGRPSALVDLNAAGRRALYTSDAEFEYGEAIRSIAPWANDDEFPMSDTEIALTVQKGERMGLDVLNHHEVEIWKDKHGIRFQLSYVLMTQWVNQILGGHLKPRYTRLTEEEKIEQGIKVTDIAIRCSFIMKEDIKLIGQMMEAGWDSEVARNELAVTGIGTASLGDWNAVGQSGTEYFAPNARSKAWKVEKRACIDAIRLRFGEPGRSDIKKMRRLRGEENITPADWQVASDETDSGRAQLAAMNADARTREPDPRPPDEVLAENGVLLHGEEEMEI